MSVSVLMLSFLERYHLHIIMLGLRRFILGCGSVVLDHAHLLQRRRVDNDHWNNTAFCEAAFPFTMLLTVRAPGEAAVDYARRAWRVLVEAQQYVMVSERPVILMHETKSPARISNARRDN